MRFAWKLLGHRRLDPGVHGATSMEFTLMPRLVLTNTSDEELELETPERRRAERMERLWGLLRSVAVGAWTRFGKGVDSFAVFGV